MNLRKCGRCPRQSFQTGAPGERVRSRHALRDAGRGCGPATTESARGWARRVVGHVPSARPDTKSRRRRHFRCRARSAACGHPSVARRVLGMVGDLPNTRRRYRASVNQGWQHSSGQVGSRSFNPAIHTLANRDKCGHVSGKPGGTLTYFPEMKWCQAPQTRVPLAYRQSRAKR
jgi:hypothetical protein